MKRIAKRTATTALAVALSAVAVMSSSAPKASAKVDSTIKKTITVGDKVQFKVTTIGFKAKKIKFKTSNKKIATVSKKGIVKGKKKGKCTITASAKGHKAVLKLTVKNKPKTNYKQQPVTLNTPVPVPTPVPQVQVNDQLVNNQLAANVVVSTNKLPSGQILFTVTNNNAQALGIVKVETVLKDAAGLAVDTTSFNLYNVPANGSDYAVYSISTKCKIIEPLNTLVSVAVDSKYLSGKNYVTNSISLQTSSTVEGEVMSTVANPTAAKIYLRGFVFYKDATGAVLAVDDIYDSVDAGQTKFIKHGKPYYKYETAEHGAFDDILYSAYQVYYQAYSYAY